MLVSIEMIGQCATTINSLPTYSLFVGQETVPMSTIREISGLTYNDITGEFFVVSDDGKLARRNTSGNWTDIDINDWSGNSCSTTDFGDIEAITYMGQVSPNTYRYAIAEERERFITFVEISNNQTSISFPDNSFLKFDNISFTAPNCGNNSGIEGVAFNVNSNTMYFGMQKNDPIIYSFDVPNNINGQSISPTEIVNLDDLNLDIYSIHGLEVFDNGNILALASIEGSENDDGLFDRIMLEFDPCGNLLSQADVEPTIPNSAELEGIVVAGNELSLIGEFGVFYNIQQEVIATPTCADIHINDEGGLTQIANIVNVSNVSTENIGDMIASNYKVSAYLSSDLNISTSDIFIGDVAVINNHAVNALYNFAFSFNLNTLNLPSGNYYVGYIIDPMDDLSECDEMNNKGVLSSSIVSIAGNSGCAMTKNINNSPIPSDIYRTQVSIHSTGTVDNQADVIFDAGNFVELDSGFEVKLNAKFEAMIDGCI